MNIFGELKRRNVFRMAIAYLVASWLLLQITDVLVPLLTLPETAGRFVLLLLVIGFIPALVFSWAYEITPEGIKRESDDLPVSSAADHTASKLNKVIVVLLIAAIAAVVIDRLIPEAREQVVTGPVTETATQQDRQAPVPDTSEAPPSVAVLPFANVSADPDNEYFSDGISEELLNLLVKVKGLRVPSRTSSFAFKGKHMDIRDIAAELEVAHVLEGSVRKAGNRVRITAQLIEVISDTHLWSETYDRELEDIFTIQNEIATRIVDAMQLVLSGETSEPDPTDNLEAYNLYLQGRHKFQQRGQDLIDAENFLKQAVALDPGFAEAWATLGLTYIMQPNYIGKPADEVIPKALEVAEIVENLNPALLEPMMIRSTVAGKQGDLGQSVLLFEHKPGQESPHALYRLWHAIVLFQAGYVGKAKTQLEIAHQMDPVSGIILDWLARAQFMTGEYEKAENNAIKGLQFDRMQSLITLSGLSQQTGDTQVSLAHAKDENPISGSSRLAARVQSGEISKEEAEAILTNIEGRAGLYARLGFYTFTQETEGIVAVFPELWDSDSTVFTTLWWPGLTELRNHPTIKTAMREFGLVDLWKLHGWPQLCHPTSDGDFECD